MVGYTISPLLWRKVKKGLSAGRVQSVATRMVCEREKEIQEFIPEEYWTITGKFTKQGDKLEFEANFYGKKGKKITPKNEEEVEAFTGKLKNAEYYVESIKRGTKSEEHHLLL